VAAATGGGVSKGAYTYPALYPSQGFEKTGRVPIKPIPFCHTFHREGGFMQCFEVWLNGQRLYTAGLPYPCNLHGHLVSRQASPNEPSPVGDGSHHFWFSGTHADGTFVGWPKHLLQVGDEIVFRMVEVDAPDEPTTRRPRDDAEFERTDRKVYEYMKQKYESSGPTDAPPTASDDAKGS
jgi:hypothetical protein